MIRIDTPSGTWASTCAYGGLSHRRKDRLYVLQHGFVYASPSIITPSTSRPAAVVLLTVDGTPFTVEVGGKRLQHSAFAVAPNVRRGLDARGVDLVSLNVAPNSPLFPAFRALAEGGVLPLDRHALSPFDDDLAAWSEGVPLLTPPSQRFDRLVEAAVEMLPMPPVPDERLTTMLAALSGQPDDAQALQGIARQIGLSYHRTSHLFSSALGIPLRSFLAWEKQRRLFKPLLIGSDSLTQVAHDAGLPDSAYLSRIYQRWYGQRPSFARSRSVEVFIGRSAYRS